MGHFREISKKVLLGKDNDRDELNDRGGSFCKDEEVKVPPGQLPDQIIGFEQPIDQLQIFHQAG